MAKYDPIISEFESEEAEQAYDVWFRAEVESALAETGPDIPHEQVMARVRKSIRDVARAKTGLAA
jgi:predicted esterase